MNDTQVAWNLISILLFIVFILGLYVGMKLEKFCSREITGRPKIKNV